MTKPKFLDVYVLYKLRRPLVTVAILVGFFFYYNIFLIDHTLEDLRFSLEQTVLAYDIGDINGLDMVLVQATAKEISPLMINAIDVGNLEYATSIVNTGTNFRQLAYLKLVLDAMIKGREKGRGTVLTLLDRISRPIRRETQAQEVAETIDIAFLEKMRAIEKVGDLQGAVLKYKKLIDAKPEMAPLLKLRLAYTHHRLGEYPEALSAYREIVKAYYPSKEAKIAKMLINALKQKGKLLRKIDGLTVEYTELPEDEIEAKQSVLYDIGGIYTRLFNLEDAQKFFRRTVDLIPSSNIGIKAQFNMAWMLKQEHKLEEGLSQFSRIIKKKPTSDLARRDSRYQMADIYHLQDKYEEAIDLYEKIAEDFKDEPIASLSLFQAGTSYMDDLHAPEKAKKIFDKLRQEYTDSAYAGYAAPKRTFIGTFITYVIPRVISVMAWRTAGLFCFSGYSDKLAKATLIFEEKGVNTAVNNWFWDVFKGAVGDISFDKRGLEIYLKKDKILLSSRITFWKFTVKSETELRFELTEKGRAKIIFTKASLNKIPLPLILINNTLANLLISLNRYFPVIITDISIKDGKVHVECFGSERILNRIEMSLTKDLSKYTEIEEIEDPNEQEKIYTLFKERFPRSSFFPSIKDDTESLFLDFFTRIWLYAGFKLLETVKDSRLYYEWSIGTLGRLRPKESRFRISYTEDQVNDSIDRFIASEFPWVANKKFLFDIKEFKVHFKDNEEIEFNGLLVLGYGEEVSLIKPQDVHVEGIMVLEIDEESKIPRMVFKKISLNGKPFLAKELNETTLLCLDILKDACLPLKLEEGKIYEEGITLRGKAPTKYSEQLFGDPNLFGIFHISEWDWWKAGIERLRGGALPSRYREYEESR